MAMKVEISVKVTDVEKDSYKDPSGYQSVELFCTDEKELLPLVDGVTSALVKVCAVQFKAALAKEEAA